MATAAVAKKTGTVVKRGTVLDIDAALLEEFGTIEVDKIPCTPIKLFGEEFNVVQTTNIFSLLLIGDDEDTAQIAKTCINLIHPEDRKRFKTAVASQQSLEGPAFVKILGLMLEAASGTNPTGSRNGSGSSRRSTTSKALSAEN